MLVLWMLLLSPSEPAATIGEWSFFIAKEAEPTEGERYSAGNDQYSDDHGGSRSRE
jgi:hypothetical protein